MNQEKIGRFIRELRIERKMTQQMLAEKIGVTDRAISKWENGRGTPDIGLLIPLSEELNITLLELLNGEKGIDEGNAIIELIKENNKKTKTLKYLFLGFINVILVIMLKVIMFGLIIPAIYSNSDSKGLTKMLSASMTPTIKENKGIIYDKVDIEDIKENDIVVYYFTDENEAFLASENGVVNVIHRVVQVKKDENGNVNLITKGDLNDKNDGIPVTLHNFVGRYNRQTLDLTAYFINSKIKNYPFIFILFILSSLGILYYDIVEIRRYYLNR